jgi:predicted Zn-dependent protease
MVKSLRSIPILIFLLALSGCATLYNPATGRNEAIFLNSQAEVSIGESVIPEFLNKHPLSNDPALNERLRRIGGRLANASDRQDILYKFYVLKDKELNAMTLPGGFVYVNQGLMNILDDDELAYVVGHEVGHVAARHIAKKLQANMAYQLLLGAAFAGFGDSSGAASNAAQGLDAVYNIVSLGYSRKDEYEADRLGAKYSFKSGFNPWSSLTALEKIKKEEGPNWKVMGYFRTHPYVEDRVAALKVAIPEVEKGAIK